jgi:hypothetical protein
MLRAAAAVAGGAHPTGVVMSVPPPVSPCTKSDRWDGGGEGMTN